MHVLYFHQHFSTTQGSAGTRSYEMAQALLKEGHTVTMVAGSYSQGVTGLTLPFHKGLRRGMVDGIDVIEFNLAYSNHMSFAERVGVFLKFAYGSAKVALLEPADVVFATSTPLTASIPGILAKFIRRKPFVFEVRDLWPELPKAMGIITNPMVLSLMSILEFISYKSADRIIGLSPGIVNGILRRGIEQARVVMVPNGCDIGLFADTSTVWRPDGIRDSDFLAVFAGTHGRANGLEAVLEAAIELRDRQRSDIKFVLVGEGKEKAALQSRAFELNLRSILFLDPLPKTRLAGLFAGADVGLQILRNVPAFYYGTSPNKFFDYISAGLPVLNNYDGWVADLIRENNCGFVVPPDDAKAFADSLIAAANDPNSLLEKGANASRLAESTFSRPLLARRWIDCLLSTATGP